MDAVEKELIEKYGSSRIPEQEVVDILERVADKLLIDRKDIKKTGPMTVSELCEHIFKLRRGCFLANFDLVDTQQVCETGEDGRKTGEKKEHDQVCLSKVLKAYIEFESRSTQPRRARKIWFVFPFLLAVLGFTLYVPKPY